MKIEQNYSLEAYNTFHLPVKTRWFMEYDNVEELEKILRDEYFQQCYSLHIGGGSNLLFVNDFDGIIVHSQIKGIEVLEETDESVCLRVGAAEIWDDVVAYATSHGWGGIENLSHIPGEAGAAAIQNIGAYGVEIKDVIERVESYNQLTMEKRLFSNEECAYAYRRSFFKNEHNDPHIVTHIVIRLQKNPVYRLDYGQLRQETEGKELSPAVVREAVIRLREQKLPDPSVIGNAGSFFMNPVISQEAFTQIQAAYPDVPSYPAENGAVKLSAGWLIEQCGFKGKRYGNVGMYEKQALVLVNYGEASGDEIALMAESVRMAVKNKFNIELTPEVKYVG
ncbi:UDP-N-acetylmuramate dehydrogenase [Parabacteroides sp. PFB2-12]|uniref:UDP-N-acetylmuramate dehydrogenase n=1 Tax=unclassified Parabacteroides TaxID=2649774 RepID=UPI002474157B|nr:MULTISPECIES: UDP-N-acetylmuramate dehydrogenase [unclassified Parabacteroides]MDH6342460.1 UDP-N-acetylmuramate dehydrogenase [Parabacteroides sp. PM6-13]MDH6390112.1 UDP-N-acetylmuramate dehydrogenase [Parabacteroides sp. PFB2-12]